ncbi:hypothetical protein G3567_10125 [Psychroflexus sp. YR1-1]|uniref:Chain length determinant protein n=1 Tax=Psychroflexus aurantiacus TaxID=2709310 RepID=A0A6B3R380_9FLAO|nr:hypothetical protein [Psychroflexus aurantiacus]NEV94498.1 hypothetical protein [Psychroflexus aurantiacus]
MSEHSSPNQTSNDEVDLSVVIEKIKSFFKSILTGIVQIFQFFWNHKVRLLIFLIIGIGLQYLLMTQTQKIYVSEYLVRTNFESTEYLYSKVSSINAKLNSEDTLFLERVFGEDYERIKELEVSPVVDVYSLINESEGNREIFELLLDEYGDLSFLEDEININEYPTHKLRIFIKGLENNELISNRLYDFLSDNAFFEELKQTALSSYREQLEQNKTIRAQIDSIIKDQRENGMMPNLNDKAVSFTVSQDFKELLTQKQGLLNNDFILRNQLSSEDAIFKTIDASFGVLSEEKNLNYFVIPLSLVAAYCLFFFALYLRNTVQSILKA